MMHRHVLVLNNISSLQIFFIMPRGVPRTGELATAQDRIKAAEAAIRKLQFDKRKIDLEIQNGSTSQFTECDRSLLGQFAAAEIGRSEDP